MTHPFPTSSRPGVVKERNEQAPLGEHPTYDEVLDVAVQYTFPCSDPIAVESCCSDLEKQREHSRDEPGEPLREDGPQTGESSSRPR
jgi:hypothetical protein